MSEHKFGHKKADKSTFSNPSLVSPHTPTLANPVKGFGLPTNNVIQTAIEESTNQQQVQSAGEQSLLLPTSHDISRIALRRPQAKLTLREPGDQYEQKADWVANQVMSRSAPTVQPEIPSADQTQNNVQSQLGNSEAVIQRKIGDGHDLTSSRFAGDPVLEACFDGEHWMRAPQTGAAVEKMQQALIDAGYTLPKFGVDGKYGNETAAAVSKFKQDRSISPSDGVIGPKTMAAFDALFSTGPTPPGPVPPGPVPPGPVPPGPVPPGPVPPGPVPPGPVPPGPTPPGPVPTGLTYEQAKKKIKDAASGWGTDEEGIYSAIRDCSERNKLKTDGEVQAILKDELSGHDLWKAQLLLEYGSESAYPPAIKEIWAATKGWGTDENRIYAALQKLSAADVQAISKVPGLRDILNDELSGKDLNAANDLLSGDYAKQIAKHKENVAFVKQELADMKKPGNPTRIRNTSEWLDPSTPGATAKNDLYILTPTHDSQPRAKEHGQDNQVAYFGDSPQFPDDSATYDAHISSKRNIHYSAPSVAGEHLEKKIWLHDPKAWGSTTVRGVMVHEVQHDADRHDKEEGHDKAFKSPEESWNRYKTEFRSYWIDGGHDGNSTASGTATKTGFDNAKQQAIFLHMYGSSPKDVYAEWLRPNYDGNTKVGSQNFQDLVHGYTKPEGVNLINSPQIDDFFNRLDKCSTSDTDLTKTPLLELDVAAKALNSDDRAYVNSPEAKRLQDMMKKNLKKSVLTHIATIINGGTEPAWAK
jgi:Putative peptidoglycan binding domain